MSVVIIPLGRKGLITVIDEADYPLVKDLTWGVSGKKAYACSQRPDGTLLYLHRLLMQAPKGLLVDHKNGSTLDNRRENLRICTKEDNARNSIMKSNNTTGFKGVCYHKKLAGSDRAKPYQARVNLNGKRKSLGYFNTAEEASQAYAKYMLPIAGEFFNIGKQ